MGLSLPHLLVVLMIVLLVFGAGKFPKVMSDIGKGIKNLKDELGDKEKEKLEDDSK